MKNYTRPDQWTKEEDAFIQAKIKEGLRNKDIKLSNRSAHAVQLRISNLKIRKIDKTFKIIKRTQLFKEPECFNEPVGVKNVTILDLTPVTCRWPVRDKFYCGIHTTQTYCSYHADIAYNGYSKSVRPVEIRESSDSQ